MIFNRVKSKVVTRYVGSGIKEVGSGITGKIPGSIPLWTYQKRTSNPESCLILTSFTCQATSWNWPRSSKQIKLWPLFENGKLAIMLNIWCLMSNDDGEQTKTKWLKRLSHFILVRFILLVITFSWRQLLTGQVSASPLKNELAAAVKIANAGWTIASRLHKSEYGQEKAICSVGLST